MIDEKGSPDPCLRVTLRQHLDSVVRLTADEQAFLREHLADCKRCVAYAELLWVQHDHSQRPYGRDHCPGCRELRQLVKIWQAFSRLRSGEIPPDVRQRVRALIDSEEAQPPPSRKRRFYSSLHAQHYFAATLAVASCLIVVGMNYWAGHKVSLVKHHDSGPGKHQLRVVRDRQRLGLMLFPRKDEKITAEDGDAVGFGASIALAADIAVVGAPRAKIHGKEEAGAVYLLARPQGRWTVQQKLTAHEDSAGAHFGHAVAILGDRLVVGAPGRAAYVFGRKGDTWIEQQVLTPSDAVTSGFGEAVALSDATVIVSASGASRSSGGAAYVYARRDRDFTPQQILKTPAPQSTDGFAQALALDGTTAFIGAPNADAEDKKGIGAVYVFTRGADSWSLTRKLSAPDPESGNHFGVRLAAAKGILAVSAGGLVYVFTSAVGGFRPPQKLTPSELPARGSFGASVSTTGDELLIGSPGEGAYRFTRGDSAWKLSEHLPSPSGSSNGFGSTVAASRSWMALGDIGWAAQDNVATGAVYFYP